jgi:uncharacterized RDD family membrane protein YckC
MNDDDTTSGPDSSGALYSNFPSRLNAMSVDTLVLVAATAAIFATAAVLERITAARVILDTAWWLLLFLYEPLCVWRFGGTVGHRAMNLRVVDNRTRASVSLGKALTRYLLKVLLGVFSFFTMSFTRRHQALHDLVTDSSVRIRDPKKAKPFQYTMGPA